MWMLLSRLILILGMAASVVTRRGGSLIFRSRDTLRVVDLVSGVWYAF